MNKLKKLHKVKIYYLVCLYYGEVAALNNCACNTAAGC